MSDTQQLYDVVIAGATPAGSAAAIRARQLQLSTLLLDAAAFPRPRGVLDWLGPAASELAEKCGLRRNAIPAADFQGVGLYSWDLRRQSRATSDEIKGRIVERAALEEALWTLAREAGTVTPCNAKLADVSLGERHVALRLADGTELRGKVFVIADGLDSPAGALAGMPSARQLESIAASARLTLPSPNAAPGLDVVIGGRRGTQIATILRAGALTQVTLVTRTPQPRVEEQFAEFLAGAQVAKVLPPITALQPVTAAVPAGAALDLETHVGKRCVLIGAAGGFASAFSAETLYPALASGWLAAESVARSLQAPVPQDELLSFNAAWRGQLAEYMRLPNTDLALLIPLVFSNVQMSERVGRAFLLGQSF